jgi:hypothetical protein
MLFAARKRKIPLTMVVLPTPGPPVVTRVLDMSASRIAANWPMTYDGHHGEGKHDE